jgi:NAD(P)-dependent dehydrogenase (short-subunit alcohol dehydrogenase family)
MEKIMEHEGRRYVVVGGTGGMGRAAAELLASRGGKVAIVGRDADRAQAVAHAMRRDVIGDGGTGIDLGAAVARAGDGLGGIDGLAVTAGPIDCYGSVADLSDADWETSFETQLMTVVRATRAAIPYLRTSGNGAIVTFAAYSVRGQKRMLPHYAAMKSAIVSLTKNISKFEGEHGIRANCIAPGAIATEALDENLAGEVFEDATDRLDALWRVMKRDWGQASALDRIGRPEDIGETVAFLLSPRAAYITGALVNVDGGTDF